MKRGILSLALLLVGADLFAGGRYGSDGYQFDGKEYEQLEFTVRVFLARDRDEMKSYGAEYAMAPRMFAKYNSKEVEAFSVLRENECIIYIKDPDWKYQPEFYGHELAHCIWGRFHYSSEP